MFLKTKPQVIVNPESNRGRTGKRWNHIKEALKVFFKEFTYEFTEKPLQAIEISRSAVKEGVELIVGVGGDGTMNEIVNGFFENKRIINGDASLGIIPSGTGCDFSKSLNIPLGLKHALEVITRTPSSLIDVGRARFKTASGKIDERFFLNVTDFGIGGEVVARMEKNRRERKASSYFKSLMATFFNYKNKHLSLRVDGKELPPQEYMVGAIANGRIFGKGMKVAPHALLDDGFFDLVLVKGMKVFEFLRNVWRIYLGTHLTHPKISLLRAKCIEVLPAIPNEEVLIEVDGEQVGSLPAYFEIIPRTLLVKGTLQKRI
ncbi:MAG: diacylglycerol/lipid kinase family protein [Acidobacteriota bacterium]